MAVKDTLQIGDVRLKAYNQEITNYKDKKIWLIVKDLTDTMRNNQLIGIAAPQIGENYTMFITEPRQTKTRSADQADKLRVFINPKITWFSKEEIIIFEGCGSVLHGQLFGPVKRPKEIRIHYTEIDGTTHWLKCDGILARVIQHEYDHLNGIEFTEKITDYKLLMSVDHYLDRIKDLPESKNAAQITIKEES